MSFIFMDNAAIDRKSRKLIRSHVAKGKNLGRILPPRRKRREVGVKTIMPICDDRREEGPLSIERQFGDGLSVYPIPNKLPPGSRSLVQRALSFLSSPFYQQDLCHVVSFENARATSMWIGYVFVDEAYFHCTVATCAAVTSTPNKKHEDSIETMRHLSDTFRLVNEKLTGDEALSDATMAVIVGMTQYERLRGQYRMGLFHFTGLERIIELRGGITQLVVDRPEIAQKIFKADVDLALHLGSETRYSAEVVAYYTTISKFRDSFRVNHSYINSNPALLTRLSSDLRDVLGEIMGLTWLLNNFSGHEAKLDGSAFNDKIILITYELVQISPLCGQRPSSSVENVLHLSLLACITTIRLGFENQVPHFSHLSEMLRNACEGHIDKDKDSQELFLWTLFMGQSSVLRQQNDAWFIPKIREITLGLNLLTWEDTLQTLSKFPWIKVLHDNSGQALWNKTKYNYDIAAVSFERTA